MSAYILARERFSLISGPVWNKRGPPHSVLCGSKEIRGRNFLCAMRLVHDYLRHSVVVIGCG